MWYWGVHLWTTVFLHGHCELLNRSEICRWRQYVANPKMSTIDVYETIANGVIGGCLLKTRPVTGVERPIRLWVSIWKWCGCFHNSITHLSHCMNRWRGFSCRCSCLEISSDWTPRMDIFLSAGLPNAIRASSLCVDTLTFSQVATHPNSSVRTVQVTPNSTEK